MAKTLKPSKELYDRIMEKVRALNTPEKILKESTRQLVKYTLMEHYPSAYNNKNYFEKRFDKEYNKALKEGNKLVPKEFRHLGKTQNEFDYNLMRLISKDKSPRGQRSVQAKFNEMALYSRAVKVVENFITYKIHEKVGKMFDRFYGEGLEKKLKQI